LAGLRCTHVIVCAMAGMAAISSRRRIAGLNLRSPAQRAAPGPDREQGVKESASLALALMPDDGDDNANAVMDGAGWFCMKVSLGLVEWTDKMGDAASGSMRDYIRRFTSSSLTA
jgi:hypothetical protein